MRSVICIQKKHIKKGNQINEKTHLNHLTTSALYLAFAFTVCAVENVILPTFDVTINGITAENEYLTYSTSGNITTTKLK